MQLVGSISPTFESLEPVDFSKGDRTHLGRHQDHLIMMVY